MVLATTAIIMVTTIASKRRNKGGMIPGWILWTAIATCFALVGVPESVLASTAVTAQMPGEAPSSNEGTSTTNSSSLGTSYAGCGLELPSGVDRDAGLSGQYLKDRQGRNVLIVPTLGVREVYSDNVTLAPHGHESRDFVTDLMPGLTVCQEAPRISSHLHYHMDSLYYAEHQSRNSIVNWVNGNMSAVIVPNHLFFNASTDYGLAVINPSQSYSLTPALDVGNRTNAWTFSLSPYFVQPVGPLGLAIARYTYNRALYNDPQIPAFFSNSVNFNVISPPKNGNWSWNAGYESAQLVSQGNYRTNYIDSASLQLGYKMTADLKVLAQGGVEDQYLPDGTIHRLRSPFWYAGIEWSDGISSLQLHYGHRFYGKSFYGKLEHQGRYLTISIAYSENPEVAGLNNMGIGLYGMPSTLGASGPLPGTNPFPGQSLVPLSSLLDTRVYLSKTLMGTISYRTGRSRIRIDGYRIRRRYLQVSTVFTTIQQDATGGDAYWRWQWNPRLFVIPRFQFEKQQYSDGETDYLTSEYLSLALLMSPTMQAGVTVEHQQRIGSTPSTSYQENAVILEVVKVF